MRNRIQFYKNQGFRSFVCFCLIAAIGVLPTRWVSAASTKEGTPQEHATSLKKSSVSPPKPSAPSPSIQKSQLSDVFYREPRPKWRIITGSILLGLSAIPIGFGGRLLYLDGKQTAPPVPPALESEQVFATRDIGIGVTVLGVAMATAGVLMIALPGKQVKVSNIATGISIAPLPNGVFMSWQARF